MNLRKTRLPVGLAVLVVLISLALVGVVYAHWTDQLQVTGTVNTGTLSAEWLGAGCFEFYPWRGTFPSYPFYYGEVEGKNVGSFSASVDPLDPSILNFTLTNAYPSYAVDCEVHYKNSGTIPWIMRGNTIEAVTSNLTGCVLTGIQDKKLKCDQLTVIFNDGIGSQVHPNEGGASSLIVHVEQPAAMGATYQFRVRMCMSNWNESMTGDACLNYVP